MRYARLDNNVVEEILTPVEGFEFAQCFAPDIVARCVECGADVRAGWVYAEGKFGPPPPAPEPTREEAAALRKAEIQARLAEIDRESIRPLRAIGDDTATEYDRQKLASLETEAAELRTELTAQNP